MKIKLIEAEGGDAILVIPDHVLNVLGWKEGDNLVIDIPTTSNTMLVYKKEAGTYRTFAPREGV